jgi:DNA-binding response OmpR family regulator
VASILLIEDDLAFGSTLVDLLEHHNYCVVQATNAAAALELARQNAYHLVLTDVRIAGDTDGVSALEAIQELQPNIRSIIMTGYADTEVPIRAARLHADDYLHKPFKLKVLLQAVEAVLQRETPFRSLYERVSAVPGRVLRWAFDARLQQLNQLRQGSCKQFFLLLRSNHLEREAAYSVFCAWEKLELDYLAATTPVHWSELRTEYGQFKHQMLKPVARSSTTAPRALFDSLLDRILQGRVEWVHLLRSVQLLHCPEARRENVESYCTYHWLWAPPPPEEDPFLGLTIAGVQLTGLRSPRLYEATREGNPRQGDLVLALPMGPEAEPLLVQEQSSGRATLLESRLGHHFLLYPGRALSLRLNLPPQGLSAEAAWRLLRPVFYQVEGYHQEGKFSGFFSLQDIDCIPGQPCRLNNFSDRAYVHQHQALGHAGALNLALYSAPEVHQQPHPTAASDQAVLGRLLFEVICGGEYPQPETRIRLRYLGSEMANEHFRQFIPRLAPLARPFYRLCHADPSQRYGSLREAILAIEAIVPP